MPFETNKNRSYSGVFRTLAWAKNNQWDFVFPWNCYNSRSFFEHIVVTISDVKMGNCWLTLFQQWPRITLKQLQSFVTSWLLSWRQHPFVACRIHLELQYAPKERTVPSLLVYHGNQCDEWQSGVLMTPLRIIVCVTPDDVIGFDDRMMSVCTHIINNSRMAGWIFMKLLLNILTFEASPNRTL